MPTSSSSLPASKLDEIVDRKRRDMRAVQAEISLAEMRTLAAEAEVPPPFAAVLRAAPMGLIAEVKRRSPSAGVIREPFDPAAVAGAYAAAGAQAVSVLMDEPYFGGGADDFVAVRTAVSLPMLYKEFVVDPWQIWQARGLGASAVLLIAGVLGEKDLAGCLETAREAQVECLVEVHDEDQMHLAAASGATCVGVNNRDLRTFGVSLETSLRLLDRAPAGCTLVSESGIRRACDVERLYSAGYHAVLVGEHLLRQEEVGEAVRALMGAVWVSS